MLDGSLCASIVVFFSVGSAATVLLLSFAVFICCLRRRLPDGAPKPSMCTTIKVRKMTGTKTVHLQHARGAARNTRILAR